MGEATSWGAVSPCTKARDKQSAQGRRRAVIQVISEADWFEETDTSSRRGLDDPERQRADMVTRVAYNNQSSLVLTTSVITAQIPSLT